MPLDGVDPLPTPKAGCLYLLDSPHPYRQSCGCARQAGSPYCVAHHALCHVVAGSRAEKRLLAEIEVVAKFVGGRVERKNPRVPPQRFMRALDERQRKQ